MESAAFDFESVLDEHEAQKLVEFSLSSPEMLPKKEPGDEKDKTCGKKASVYYRERRKNEVDYLVSRKRALEVELEQLHEKKLSQEVEAKRLKHEAATQQNLLRDAEGQNSALRTKLLSQMDTLKLLESFFMSQNALCVFASKQPVNPLYSLPSDAAARHCRFRDSIATALGELDDVMAAKHLSPPAMPLPHIDTAVRYQPTKSNAKIEIEVIRVVEFPGVEIQHMGAALWQLIHYQLDRLMCHDPSARSEVLEEIDSNTLYTRYQCQFAQGQPLVESYSVCHRAVVSTERINFVYRCFLDDERFPAGENFSRHDENGYIVLYVNPVTTVTTAKMVSFLRPLANAANAPVGLVTEEFMSYLHDSSSVAMRILQQNLRELIVAK
ncbi:Aste57867_18802 [Aphanomyces stellatus]|uniref:Aste57867_18802 protein n=1 Tax=Aphanomyces stellatus TaxID=120398 RepID=A0A485LBX2_9STRA|nr:hypothetical protein As57867_018738 [Aphanomyces stellatus]VFT95536.1 Aste57867_18802 [Aphanomyces stellatus]